MAKEKTVTLVSLETIRGKRVIIGAFESRLEAEEEFLMKFPEDKYDVEEINWFPKKRTRSVKENGK